MHSMIVAHESGDSLYCLNYILNLIDTTNVLHYYINAMSSTKSPNNIG